MAPLRDICSGYCLFDKLLLNSFITCKKIFLLSLGVKTNFKVKPLQELIYFFLHNFKPGAESEPPHKKHSFIE